MQHRLELDHPIVINWKIMPKLSSFTSEVGTSSCSDRFEPRNLFPEKIF